MPTTTTLAGARSMPAPSDRRRQVLSRGCCSFLSPPPRAGPGERDPTRPSGRPGRGARGNGVDDHGQVGAVPQAEEVEGSSSGPTRSRRDIAATTGDRRRAGAVVAPVLAPQSGHDHLAGSADAGALLLAARSPGHARTTVTSRKWAAHEIQGSWLRTACSQRQDRSSSDRSRALATTRRRSASIVIWFCEVGGTMRAVTISRRRQRVGVEEQAPRRLGDAGAHPAPQLKADCRRARAAHTTPPGGAPRRMRTRARRRAPRCSGTGW